MDGSPGAKEAFAWSAFAKCERTVLDALLQARAAANASLIGDVSEQATNGRPHPTLTRLTTGLDRRQNGGTDRLDGFGDVRDESAETVTVEDDHRDPNEDMARPETEINGAARAHENGGPSSRRSAGNGDSNGAAAATNGSGSEGGQSSLGFGLPRNSWYQEDGVARADQLLAAGAAPEEIAWILENEIETADLGETVDLALSGSQPADEVGPGQPRPWRPEPAGLNEA